MTYEGHGAGAAFPPVAAPDPSYGGPSFGEASFGEQPYGRQSFAAPADETGSWYGYGGVTTEQTGSWSTGTGYPQADGAQAAPSAQQDHSGQGWQQPQDGYAGYGQHTGYGTDGAYATGPHGAGTWSGAAFTGADATGQFAAQDLSGAVTTGYAEYSGTAGSPEYQAQPQTGYRTVTATEYDYTAAYQEPVRAAPDQQTGYEHARYEGTGHEQRGHAQHGYAQPGYDPAAGYPAEGVYQAQPTAYAEPGAPTAVYRQATAYGHGGEYGTYDPATFDQSTYRTAYDQAAAYGTTGYEYGTAAYSADEDLGLEPDADIDPASAADPGLEDEFRPEHTDNAVAGDAGHDLCADDLYAEDDADPEDPVGDPGATDADAASYLGARPAVAVAPMGGRAAARAATRKRGRPHTGRRSALLTIAVPSVAVMGVAAAAAVTVSVPDQAHQSAKDSASAGETPAKTTLASSKLDSQLAGLRKDADAFADRVSRNQARIDLKQRQADARKRKEELRPKFVLPVAQHGLSATFGMAGTHWAALHTGIDFPVSWGTSVRAATDGTVRTQWNSAYGYMAIVTAADGTETWYCHLSSYKIRTGQVKAGDTIAFSGSSGNSTGPHLHFEVHPGGDGTPAVDPIPWLLSHGINPR